MSPTRAALLAWCEQKRANALACLEHIRATHDSAVCRECEEDAPVLEAIIAALAAHEDAAEPGAPAPAQGEPPYAGGYCETCGSPWVRAWSQASCRMCAGDGEGCTACNGSGKADATHALEVARAALAERERAAFMAGWDARDEHDEPVTRKNVVAELDYAARQATQPATPSEREP